ncbi:MAG: hypothetical protein Q9181_007392, partial [Wetmoreana brouardii]
MIDIAQIITGTDLWSASKDRSLITIQELSESTSSSQASSSSSALSSSSYGITKDPDPSFTQPPGRCPFAKEFQQARNSHPVLASTGCTQEFCQAGRFVHTDEPRIGENRAIEVVEKEAEGFLQELYREHFFVNEEAFTTRLHDILLEIRTSAHNGIIREGKQHGMIGGNWQQTPAELEFGIRRAWRNARKCIMRSHCEELKLCDLRNVTSSAEMASELVRHMCEAFNGGNVLPTVFLFPPRKMNTRGPMIWNHQFLEFAGYEMDDGSILGDPMSAELTKAIIGLGWQPPNPKSRWDLLPLVVMADNDVPAMIKIPPELGNLVEIRHPRFKDRFDSLDLKWVAFPALTRLGFDIGGVQYTAAPFIGWFMDAEIGVRDLADSFRYNVLPDVAKTLGLLDGKVEDGVESLDDLPEYERLSILNRAQTELTYAVYWSYQQVKVSMSDTLTASMKWCRYDDDFKAKNGYRLPADPYWLAPPQGSIVPVWHRGGAPNYQPKPMICKHVQDPIKAWQREKKDWFVATKPLNIVANILPKRPIFEERSTSSDGIPSTWKKSHIQDTMGLLGERHAQRPTTDLKTLIPIDTTPQDLPSSPKLYVSIYFCSAGTFAEKVAQKLHIRLRDLAKCISNVSISSQVETLDKLEASAVTPSTIVLIVVSSTGQGEVPTNGSRFINMRHEKTGQQLAVSSASFKYAIYGNGDSRYAATYNGAAVTVEQKIRQIGGLPIAGGLYQGDTALQSTALQALSPWWAKLRPSIQDLATDSPKLKRANSDDDYSNGQTLRPTDSCGEAQSRIRTRSTQLQINFHAATVKTMHQPPRDGHQGTYLVTLDIGPRVHEDMSCVQVLPVNSPPKVRRALRALGVSGSARISLGISDADRPTYSAFLTEYIDLDLSFQSFEWLRNLDTHPNPAMSEDKLTPLPSLDALEYLHTLDILPTGPALTSQICLALPLLHPRTYSVASSQCYTSPTLSFNKGSKPKASLSSTNSLDILVKPLPLGRFSHTFLSSPLSTPLRYRLLPSSASSLLAIPSKTPLIIIATGAGFAPVRCLLQRRIASASHQPSSSNQPSENNISLFLGLKPLDVPLFSDTLNEAAAAGVLE